jgi:hypothetical protein
MMFPYFVLFLIISFLIFFQSIVNTVAMVFPFTELLLAILLPLSVFLLFLMKRRLCIIIRAVHPFCAVYVCMYVCKLDENVFTDSV